MGGAGKKATSVQIVIKYSTIAGQEFLKVPSNPCCGELDFIH